MSKTTLLVFSKMISDQFNAKFEVAFNMVKDIFESPSKIQFNTFTKDSPNERIQNRNRNNHQESIIT